MSAVGVTLAVSAPPSSAGSSPSVAASHGAGAAAGAMNAGAIADAGTGVARASTGVLTVGSSSPTASYPAWCCSAGNPIGLTATGQATVRGSDAAARASAIASAVADAESQAKAAAQEAGISLGRIINIEVSTPYYPYPIPFGAARAGSATAAPGAPRVSGAPGSGAPTSACPAGSQCAYPVVTTYASVTMTWAIG